MFHDQFFGWNQKSKTQQKVGLGPAQSTYLRALSPEPWLGWMGCLVVEKKCAGKLRADE